MPRCHCGRTRSLGGRVMNGSVVTSPVQLRSLYSKNSWCDKSVMPVYVKWCCRATREVLRLHVYNHRLHVTITDIPPPIDRIYIQVGKKWPLGLTAGTSWWSR